MFQGWRRCCVSAKRVEARGHFSHISLQSRGEVVSEGSSVSSVGPVTRLCVRFFMLLSE